MPNKLTERRRRFVEAYLLNPNATVAAREAGYSTHTAHVLGSRQLKRPDVQTAIKEAQTKATEAAGITIEWIADRLQTEATTAEKPADRTRALELLGKWRGMFIERVQSITYDTTPLQEFSIEELRAFALAKRPLVESLALSEGKQGAIQGPGEAKGSEPEGAGAQASGYDRERVTPVRVTPVRVTP